MTSSPLRITFGDDVTLDDWLRETSLEKSVDKLSDDRQQLD